MCIRDRVGEGRDVGAGAEVLASSGQQYDADGRVGVQLLERRDEPAPHGSGERVELVRTVQDDRGDVPLTPDLDGHRDEPWRWASQAAIRRSFRANIVACSAGSAWS